MLKYVLCVTLALFARVSAFYPEHTLGESAFEELINKTVEELKKHIPNPFVIDSFVLKFPPDAIVTGEGYVSQFLLYGSNQFHLSQIKADFSLTNSKINFTLVMPVAKVNTNYGMNLLISKVVPFYGHGAISAYVGDIEVEGYTELNIIDHSVKNTKVVLRVGSANLNINGLIENESFSFLFGKLLSDNFDSFINTHPKFISNILSPLIEDTINNLLQLAKALHALTLDGVVKLFVNNYLR